MPFITVYELIVMLLLGLRKVPPLQVCVVVGAIWSDEDKKQEKRYEHLFHDTSSGHKHKYVIYKRPFGCFTHAISLAKKLQSSRYASAC